MNVLITGANGFIGSRTADALLKDAQHNVFLTGRKPLRDRQLLLRGANFAPGDLTDRAFSDRVTRGIDAIVHCAGRAGTWGPYADFYSANVLATQNLLASAAKSQVRRFINISSPSIYFDFRDQFNLRETDLPNRFSNHYARSKWQAEEIVRQAHSQDLLTVSLRPRSVIGAGDQNVLPRLLRLQREGRLVQIGDGKNVIDVTTVGNLIDAISLCLHAPPAAMGEAYNITNGEPILFWRFVEMVLSQAGLPLNRRRMPYVPAMMAAGLNELVHKLLQTKSEPALLPISIGVLRFSMTLDITKARHKLGYVPRLNNEDGIAEFMPAASDRL